MADTAVGDRTVEDGTVEGRRVEGRGVEGRGVEERGTLTIADKVREKIAVRSALDVSDVVRYQSAIGSVLGGSTPGRSLLGGDYPQATVDIAGAAVDVTVSIAVRWPSPVAAVCDRVRTHVADELERLVGVRPTRVDVSVAQIVSAESGPSSSRVAAPSKNGFAELEAVQA